MKMINKTTIEKILNQYDNDPFEDFEAPCWEIKIDHNKIFFIIDFKEIFSMNINSQISMEHVNVIMPLFKNQKISQIKEFINGL